MTRFYDDPDSFYPKDIVRLMAEGKSNVEIMAEWDVNEQYFYKLLRENKSLQDAYEIGLPKRKAYYIEAARKCWKNGEEKGFRYFKALSTEVIDWRHAEESKGNTTVNIQGNLNITQNQTAPELIEFLKKELPNLPIDVPYIELKPEEIKDENKSR